MDQQTDGNIWRFMNHSENPNVYLDSFLDNASGVEVIKVFAERKIKVGEEMCINYGKGYWMKNEK